MALHRFWSAHEISLMLQILHRDNYGPVLFVAGARRNEKAFMRASEELAANEYSRISVQCRSKFKCLRQSFTKVLLDFGPDPPRRSQSPFWRELKALWVQSQEPDPAHLFPPDASHVFLARNTCLRHSQSSLLGMVMEEDHLLIPLTPLLV
ncbi:hypothetical protein JRQ81_002481 [Phrynocephalus forsythii]|uniref:Myb/SANT-like DNA-binding domain-containing protein n=1 Tax=Phrynocephalus forsythii TaxID=171643 RepID=A0A9Q1AWK3_9SAUR|nr:hypothetical protein JRQ81_002481 [Phrynocephalus forsythii]